MIDSKIKQQIKDLRVHLSLPWKEEAYVAARIELATLIAEYGEPEPELNPKLMKLF